MDPLLIWNTVNEGSGKISASLPCPGAAYNQKEGSNAKMEMYDLPIYLRSRRGGPWQRHRPRHYVRGYTGWLVLPPLRSRQGYVRAGLIHILQSLRNRGKDACLHEVVEAGDLYRWQLNPEAKHHYPSARVRHPLSQQIHYNDLLYANRLTRQSRRFYTSHAFGINLQI